MLSKTIELAGTALAAGLIHHHHPDNDENVNDQHIRKQRHPPWQCLIRLDVVFADDALFELFLGNGGKTLLECAVITQLIRDGLTVFEFHGQNIVTVQNKAFDLLVMEIICNVAEFFLFCLRVTEQIRDS